MIPTWFYPAFYGTCGVLVVVLLYRIWSKSRATAVQKTIAPQTMVPPLPTAVTTSAAAKDATVSPMTKETTAPPSAPVAVTHTAAVAPAAATRAATPVAIAA